MEHFSTFSDYLRFSWAKEFVSRTPPDSSFQYSKNGCEKVGDLMGIVVLRPLDFSMKNSRHPLFILALTVVAVCIVTVLFYPVVVAGLISAVVLTGIKVALYSLLISTIMGVCLRTLGRLNNRTLMAAWDKNLLIPQSPGAFRI